MRLNAALYKTDFHLQGRLLICEGDNRQVTLYTLRMQTPGTRIPRAT
jgi:hypothetical protein